MLVEPVDGYFTRVQSYSSSGLRTNSYVSSLMARSKTRFSPGPAYFNRPFFQKLDAVNNHAIDLRSQIGGMALLTQHSLNADDADFYSNELKMPAGVTVTLNRTGSSNIAYEADFSPAVGAVQKFLDTFNNLLDAASDSPIQKRFADAADNSGSGLYHSGIGVDSSGKLNINDLDKLRESISDGSFAKNFKEMNSFGQKLQGMSLNLYNPA